MMSLLTEEGMEEYVRMVDEYWRKVDESEGFDVEDARGPVGFVGLVPYDCEDGYFHPVLVKQYAMVGLQRYNMLKGTNFQLHHVKKYNQSWNLISPYYITLLAQDPTRGCEETFQVLVEQESYGRLDLTCSVARPLGSPKEPLMPQDDTDVNDFYKGSLPEWPSEISFNDRKRFYLVKKSELLDNGWINLYLHLVLSSHDERLLESHLSDFQIVEAAIETVEDVEPQNARLNAKCAIVYITYKDLAKARTGDHAHRRAIVRRVINERTGYFTLLGGFPAGDEHLHIWPSNAELGREPPLAAS